MESESNVIEQKFIETYTKPFFDLRHFRKIYTGEELNDMLASKVSTNVDIILKSYFDEEVEKMGSCRYSVQK